MRRVLLEGAAALLAYVVISVLVTWPLAAHINSHVIGDSHGDMGGGVGWLWSLAQEEGYHVFGQTKHTLTGAPLGWEQGNALNLQWLLVYYPMYLLSLVSREVVAFNVTAVSGLALSALAMYALARRLGCSPLVSGWAGLVFLLFPWHIWRVNVGHASLAHLEVFPVLFIALHAWTRRPTASRAALVGLATAAAWLTSGYWGAMVLIGALAFVAAATVVRARAERIRSAVVEGAWVVASVLAGSAVVGLASIPGRAAGGVTIPRTLGELSIFGARPSEFLVPAAGNPVLGALADASPIGLHGSNPAETELFLGWLTIALAASWIVLSIGRRRALSPALVATTAGLASSLVAALAFAAPSPVGIAGRIVTWPPSWLLFQILPEVRVPSRFTALIAATLIPLAALGLQSARDAVCRRAGSAGLGRSLGVATVTLAIAVSVVELYPDIGPMTRADTLPDIYRAVARTPRGVLAEYSLVEGSDYRFWQRLHGRPLLNGARPGTAADDLRRGLVDPGTPGTAEALALLGVTAITTRADALDYTDGVPDVPNANWGNGYKLVERFPDGSSVWDVVARPAPAVAFLRSPGFGGPEKPNGHFIGYPLLDGHGAIELRAKTPGRIRISFETETPSGASGVFRISGAPGDLTFPLSGRRRVTFVAWAPRGVSQLMLTAALNPLDTSIIVSAPRATRAKGAPVVRAEARDPDSGL